MVVPRILLPPNQAKSCERVQHLQDILDDTYTLCTTPTTATITDKMANACAHSFRMIKSDSTLIQWVCQHCRSGPHWMIFECTYCKLHLCRPCTQAA
ncbi:hypothetical protein BHE90_009300 [Fusarium euwallaceae]|uniref:Uncharacterized protein n=4 Tax=Fusarium solani species complex TaxID=232080 RepID=A0A3M2SK40_9HYPO|nr:hypothetical protein CDV36_002426 [Fusarium kuroshium]RSM00987.1 hypothetical protein CEP52_008771 [Fusarium oligoseptatum]RSM06773.1 hypothetical protein CDV31_008956 [Fusarium ambrosium]RTE76233.1 hypothetical protein BHE90_009300 [Fusarium euwallaceae]